MRPTVYPNEKLPFRNWLLSALQKHQHDKSIITRNIQCIDLYDPNLPQEKSTLLTFYNNAIFTEAIYIRGKTFERLPLFERLPTKRVFIKNQSYIALASTLTSSINRLLSGPLSNSNNTTIARLELIDALYEIDTMLSIGTSFIIANNITLKVIIDRDNQRVLQYLKTQQQQLLLLGPTQYVVDTAQQTSMLSTVIARNTLINNYSVLFNEMNHVSINVLYDLYIVSEIAPPQLPTTSNDKYVIETLAPSQVYDNSVLTQLSTSTSINILAQQQIDAINAEKTQYLAILNEEIIAVNNVITAQTQLDNALETYQQRMTPQNITSAQSATSQNAFFFVQYLTTRVNNAQTIISAQRTQQEASLSLTITQQREQLRLYAEAFKQRYYILFYSLLRMQQSYMTTFNKVEIYAQVIAQGLNPKSVNDMSNSVLGPWLSAVTNGDLARFTYSILYFFILSCMGDYGQTWYNDFLMKRLTQQYSNISLGANSALNTEIENTKSLMKRLTLYLWFAPQLENIYTFNIVNAPTRNTLPDKFYLDYVGQMPASLETSLDILPSGNTTMIQSDVLLSFLINPLGRNNISSYMNVDNYESLYALLLQWRDTESKLRVTDVAATFVQYYSAPSYKVTYMLSPYVQPLVFEVLDSSSLNVSALSKAVTRMQELATLIQAEIDNPQSTLDKNILYDYLGKVKAQAGLILGYSRGYSTEAEQVVYLGWSSAHGAQREESLLVEDHPFLNVDYLLKQWQLKLWSMGASVARVNGASVDINMVNTTFYHSLSMRAFLSLMQHYERDQQLLHFPLLSAQRAYYFDTFNPQFIFDYVMAPPQIPPMPPLVYMPQELESPPPFYQPTPLVMNLAINENSFYLPNFQDILNYILHITINVAPQEQLLQQILQSQASYFTTQTQYFIDYPHLFDTPSTSLQYDSYGNPLDENGNLFFYLASSVTSQPPITTKPMVLQITHDVVVSYDDNQSFGVTLTDEINNLGGVTPAAFVQTFSSVMANYETYKISVQDIIANTSTFTVVGELSGALTLTDEFSYVDTFMANQTNMLSDVDAQQDLCVTLYTQKIIAVINRMQQIYDKNTAQTKTMGSQAISMYLSYLYMAYITYVSVDQQYAYAATSYNLNIQDNESAAKIDPQLQFLWQTQHLAAIQYAFFGVNSTSVIVSGNAINVNANIVNNTQKFQPLNSVTGSGAINTLSYVYQNCDQTLAQYLQQDWSNVATHDSYLNENVNTNHQDFMAFLGGEPYQYDNEIIDFNNVSTLLSQSYPQYKMMCRNFVAALTMQKYYLAQLTKIKTNLTNTIQSLHAAFASKPIFEIVRRTQNEIYKTQYDIQSRFIDVFSHKMENILMSDTIAQQIKTHLIQVYSQGATPIINLIHEQLFLQTPSPRLQYSQLLYDDEIQGYNAATSSIVKIIYLKSLDPVAFEEIFSFVASASTNTNVDATLIQFVNDIIQLIGLYNNVNYRSEVILTTPLINTISYGQKLIDVSSQIIKKTTTQPFTDDTFIKVNLAQILNYYNQ